MDLYTLTNSQVITMPIIHIVFTKCSFQLEENTYLSKNKRGLKRFLRSNKETFPNI